MSSLSYLDLAIAPSRQVSTLGLEVPKIEVPAIAATVHHRIARGPLEAIKDAYKRLEDFYHQAFPITFQCRFAQIQLGLLKGGTLLSSLYKVLNPVMSIFRNMISTGEQSVFKETIWLVKFAKKTRLLSIFSLPASLVQVVKGGYECVLSVKKKERSEALEQALNVADSLGDLSHGISTFIDCLMDAAVVNSSAALTAASTYLTGIGVILSVASIGLQCKFIYESVKLKNRITRLFDSKGKADFQSVVKEIDKLSHSRLARTVGVSDGEKLKARLHAIYERNSDPLGNAEHKKNLVSTVKALKNRIHWNNIGRYLKITAAVISIIAVSILLFSPVAPIGYLLVAVSAAIGLAVLLIDYKAEQDLNCHLKALAPKDSREMWKLYGKKQYRKKLKNDPMLRIWDLSNLGKDVQREALKRDELLRELQEQRRLRFS